MLSKRIVFYLSVSLVFLMSSMTANADDIVIADFEGDSYGDWKLEGKVFGSEPAKGSSASPRTVVGYQGARVASSHGDGAGKLVSPIFKLERRFLNILIGGGYSGGTSVSLLVLKDESWQNVETVPGTRYASWPTQEMK
jgi:fructan beta-fructosidase